ncbi:MAG: hypothetical protein ACOCP4_03095 [Candidatus Woesearchaeota archaeon]
MNLDGYQKKIKEIQNFLVEHYGHESWKEFIENQEMGDCQSIVSVIAHRFPECVPCFGEIKVDEPFYNIEHDEMCDVITHHWVELEGEILDFSKGTLLLYIESYDDGEYNPEDIEENLYKNIYQTNLGTNVLNF